MMRPFHGKLSPTHLPCRGAFKKRHPCLPSRGAFRQKDPSLPRRMIVPRLEILFLRSQRCQCLPEHLTVCPDSKRKENVTKENVRENVTQENVTQLNLIRISPITEECPTYLACFISSSASCCSCLHFSRLTHFFLQDDKYCNHTKYWISNKMTCL